MSSFNLSRTKVLLNLDTLHFLEENKIVSDVHQSVDHLFDSLD